MKKTLLLMSLLIPLLLNGQDQNKWGIKFSGFVKNDFIFDSRQVETIREGHFLLYPMDVKYDADSADVNAQANFNILSIQSRLVGNISAPDALGAKTSGLIEAEFFGTSNADINGFRLRHAYVKLNWKSTELLLGQTWHPMFMSSCFPEVVSFNTGVPFQPFARNPQLRVTQKFWKMNLIAAVMAQRDFTSPGPDGANSKYIRNSAIPDMHLQLYFRTANEERQSEFIAGIGGGYKFLKPRLVTDSNYKTTEKIGSLSAIAYIKHKTKYITWKLEGVYGQNMYDLLMLGGYAIQYDTVAANLIRDDRSYTSLDVFSVWGEVYANVKNFQFGIFGGYTQNMGSLNNIADWTSASSFYTRGRDISYIYRFSPRIVYNAGKLRIALEGEHTTAAYAKTNASINSLGEISEVRKVSNYRVLLGVFYFF